MPIHDVVRQQIRIAGIELAHAAQLAPRRHRQRDIPLARPLLGNRRVHLVARQEQDRRRPLRPAGRAAIPGGDAHVVEAVVKDLEHLDVIRRPQRVGDHLRRQRNRRRLLQHALPERVEVVRLCDLGLVIGCTAFGMASPRAACYAR